MVKWEYAVTMIITDTHQLNELGAKGWELVGTGNGFMYFKRPAIEAPKAAPRAATPKPPTRAKAKE